MDPSIFFWLIVAALLLIGAVTAYAIATSPKCTCGDEKCGGGCDHMQKPAPRHWWY